MHSNPSASSRALRRRIRLGVATITSTALVGGVLVAAPAHPLLPTPAVAQAQQAAAYLPNDISTAQSTLIDLALIADSGLLSEEDRLTVLEAIQSQQAWPQDGTGGPETGSINLDLLQGITLDIGGVSIPLIDDGSGNGLLEVGTGGVGVLNSYADAQGVTGVEATTGAVNEDGSLNVDPTTGAGGVDTTVHLTALTDQLGLSGLTELAVNELSLTLGAVGSRAEKNGDEIQSEYSAATAELTIGSETVSQISTTLDEAGAGLDETVEELAGDEGLVNEILGILQPVLGVALGTPEITIDSNLEGLIGNLVTAPLYDGATPEESLVVIDLGAGEINVNLENLHQGNLNDLTPNTELVSAQQVTEITSTVNDLLNSLTDRVENTLDEGLLDTQLTIEVPGEGLVGWLTGAVIIDGTLGGLLGDPDFEDPTIDGGLVAGLLELVTGVLRPIGVVVQGVLEGPIDALVDSLLGADGPVGTLLESLDPLLGDLLQNVLSVTVNRQEQLEDGLAVSALDVRVLDVTGTSLVALPLATSAVTAPSQAEIDAGLYAPEISALDPDSGETAGGAEVTITGSNLVTTDPETGETVNAVTAVNFGDTVVEGDAITANPDGSISVVSPAVDTEGEVDVTVETGGGESNALPFIYGEVLNDAARLIPAYEDGSVAQGEEAEIAAPTFDDVTTEDVVETDPAPAETSFAAGADAPEWAVVDEATGAITVSPGTDVSVDSYTVPVEVIYADGSTETVDVAVEVTEVLVPEVEGTPSEVEPTDAEQDTGLDLVNGSETTEVTAADEDDQDIPVQVAEDGSIQVTPGEDVDGPITVTVDDDLLDAPLEIDVPVVDHAEGVDDNGSDAVVVTGAGNPVEANGQEQDSGYVVENHDAETEFAAVDEDEQNVPVRGDEAGSIFVTPAEDVDGPITLTVEDTSVEDSIVRTIEVVDHAEGVDDNESEQPRFDGEVVPVDPTDEQQDAGVDLVNGENSTVTAADEDGQDIPVELGADGSVLVTPGVDVDGPITVTVDDDLLDAPLEIDVPVVDHAEGVDDNESEYAGPTVGGEANEVEPTEQEQDSGLDVVDGSEDTTVSATDEETRTFRPVSMRTATSG